MSTALTTALIGLGGVLGAAIVVAGAAIFGPSLLHRSQRRSKHADDAASKREAAISRLVKFRTTGRAWFDALERFAEDFDAGRAVDLDGFDALVGPLRDGTVQSVYEMAFDDAWVPSMPMRTIGEVVPPTIGEIALPTSDNEILDTNAHRAKSDVLDCLRRATKLLRADVRDAQVVEKQGVSDSTWKAIDQARRARAELNTSLLAQIEKITRQ